MRAGARNAALTFLVLHFVGSVLLIIRIAELLYHLCQLKKQSLNSSATMIRSMFSSRSHAHERRVKVIRLPRGHSASFSKLDYLSTKEKSDSTRICSCCRKAKPVSHFPMSLRKSRNCRFCERLKSSGLEDLSSRALLQSEDEDSNHCLPPPAPTKKKSRRGFVMAPGTNGVDDSPTHGFVALGGIEMV